IAGRAIPCHFCIDGGPTSSRVFQIFQDQHSRSLAQDEPVTAKVKRPRGLRGFLIECREGCQQIKSRDSKWMDHDVSAAAKHDVGVAVSNELRRFAQGLATSSASGEAIVIRALQVKIVCQMTGSGVEFLFRFPPGMEAFQASLGETYGVDRASFRA